MKHFLVSTHWGNEEGKSLCGKWLPRPRGTYGKTRETLFSSSLDKVTCKECLSIKIARLEVSIAKAKRRLKDEKA